MEDQDNAYYQSLKADEKKVQYYNNYIAVINKLLAYGMDILTEKIADLMLLYLVSQCMT